MSIKHDPSDCECVCEECLQEQIRYLDEMIIRKAAQDTQGTENHIINITKKMKLKEV